MVAGSESTRSLAVKPSSDRFELEYVGSLPIVDGSRTSMTAEAQAARATASLSVARRHYTCNVSR